MSSKQTGRERVQQALERQKRLSLQTMLASLPKALGGLSHDHSPYRNARIHPNPYARYEKLAGAMFTDFTQTANPNVVASLRLTLVENGFRTITRILQFAPEAYQIHCQQVDKQPQLMDLAAILRASRETPYFLAAQGNEHNEAYERGLLVYDSQPISPARPPFVITEHYDGLVTYDPHPEIIESVMSGLPDPSSEAHEKCPARGRLLNTIWDAAISRCVQNASLFPADMNESYPNTAIA